MTFAERRIAARPSILCTGIIVLDEVFLVERFPAARRQDAGEGLLRGQRRLRRQCRGRDRAARRARVALPARSAVQPARTRTATGCLPRLRARTSTAPAACASRAADAAFGDLHRRARRADDRDLPRRAALPRRDAARSETRLVASADAVLADNRFPDFVRPICQAARARGIHRGARRRQADRPTDDAVSDRHPRGLFRRMPARDDRS